MTQEKDKTPREIVREVQQAENTLQEANRKVWNSVYDGNEAYKSAKAAAHEAKQEVSAVRDRLKAEADR